MIRNRSAARMRSITSAEIRRSRSVSSARSPANAAISRARANNSGTLHRDGIDRMLAVAMRSPARAGPVSKLPARSAIYHELWKLALASNLGGREPPRGDIAHHDVVDG